MTRPDGPDFNGPTAHYVRSPETDCTADSPVSEPSVATPTVTAVHGQTPVQLPAKKYPGYELLEWIADGGMGTVFRARELALDRVVALKELKSSLFDAASARLRFANEQRTMARIEHPNLVPIYHSGDHDGLPFFTMKFMPGGTLPTGRSGRTYAPDEAAELLRGIAAGVAALHDRGILHRDLKPSNILLDEHGVPYVADFGLAKWLDEDVHTQTGLRNGTPPYMSPEQVAGRSRRLTATCDVWALGVIGYELLAGRRPFDDPDWEELFRQIREAPPPPLPPDVPPALAGIIHRCLRKDPLERYPSAAEVRDVLARYLAGDAISDPEAVTTLAETTVTDAPTRRRFRRRAFLGIVLGGGAVGAVGGAGYLVNRLLRPDPTLPPSFAEQAAESLKGGRTVELLGDDGRPKWSDVLPPKGLIEVTSPDGTYTIKPNPNGPQLQPNAWLELFNHPLDVPYRFECELCYRDLKGNAAAYLGRREWESASGPWQTAALLRHTPPNPPVDESTTIEFWANPVNEKLAQTTHLLSDPPVRLPPGQQPLNRWVRLAFDLRRDVVSGECDGVPVPVHPTRTGPAFRARLPREITASLAIHPKDERPAVPGFADAPTLFGPGVGVFVFRATVSIRAARLVPLTPPPGAH